jgi:hypothetical protein
LFGGPAPQTKTLVDAAAIRRTPSTGLRRMWNVIGVQTKAKAGAVCGSCFPLLTL